MADGAAVPIRRALSRFGDPIERAGAVVAVPALMAFIDAAKMSGYLAGLRDRAEAPDRASARVRPG